MDNPPTILLFDLDGTLVSTGGAGRKALSAALQARHNREDLLNFTLGGLTDKLIVRRALEGAGLPSADSDVDTLLQHYLILLEDEVAKAEGYRVLPGVKELLDQLWRRRKVAVGLGTGNLEQGARIKLERGKLNHFFSFGGFGSDSDDRASLLWTGVQRGAEQLRLSPERCKVTIIGDTPRDIAAAQDLNLRSVGVGTGGYSREELLRVGATAALDDLTAPEAQRVVLGIHVA